MAEVEVPKYTQIDQQGNSGPVHVPYSGPTPSSIDWDQFKWHPQVAPGHSSLDDFLAGVRSSCEEHAARKGYLEDSGNVAGEVSKLLGISRDHAIGEILYKLLEFRKSPRKVIAVKIAGWAWRLWLEAKE